MNDRALLMKTIRTAAPLAIVAAGIVGFILIGKLKSTPAAAEPTKVDPLVETAIVEPHEGGLDIVVDGIVTPYREIALSAQVAGRIETKAEICKAGNFVTAGQLLLAIDPRDYELDVKRLTKELEQAGVMLQELDEEVKGIQEMWELANEDVQLRTREVRRQEKIVSVSREADLDQARQAELAARQTRLNSENQLRLLKTRRSRLEFAQELTAAQLEKAQLDLERTKITAPISGVIVSESVEADSYVQTGTELVAIEDTSKVEVKCNLRMDELYWVWRQVDWASVPRDSLSGPNSYEIPPTEVSVVYRLGGYDFVWRGVLSRYDGIGLDEKTRTMPCRVLVENPLQVETPGVSAAAGHITGPRALVRGMFVTVKIHAQPRAELFQIPESALRPGNMVWRVRDGVLSIEKVHFVELLSDENGGDAGAGEDLRQMAIIHAERSDLEAGDRVVTGPLSYVRSGMAVNAKDESS